LLRFLQKPLRYTYKNTLFILIGINIVVYFLTTMNREFFNYLALNPAYFLKMKFYWTPLTYMFTHADMSHILFNMLGLFFFGPHVEERMGSSEFLLFYLFCGIGTGLISLAIYITTGMYYVFLLGASGVIFAVLLAYAVYFPNSKVYFFGLIPMKTPVMVGLYAGLEIFFQLTGIQGGVSHLAHLTGLALALLYFPIRLKINPITTIRDGRNNFWNK